MPDLTTRIQALDGGKAVRILQTISNYRLSGGQADDVTPDHDLAGRLAAELGTAAETSATDADLARAALLLLADDEEMRPVLVNMLDHPPADSFVVGTGVAIGAAALVVLQSYIKFERDKSGKWTFKFEHKPMSDSLLKAVITKLGGWMVGKAG